MLHKRLLLLLIIPLICFGIWDADTHTINNWNFPVTNYGRFGDRAIWKPDSIPGGLWACGFWFGFVSEQSETLVTIGYGAAGGECEFVPGLEHQDLNSQIARVYMYPKDWPANSDTYPMAPHVPLTAQVSWCCYNDFDSAYHMPGDGMPIGIEVYQTTYVDSLSIVGDVVYFKYSVKNCTSYTIDDAYATVVWDYNSPQNDTVHNGYIHRKWFHPQSGDSFLVEHLGFIYGDTILGYFPDTFAYGILLIKTPEDVGCSAFNVYWLRIAPHLDSERYRAMAGYNYATGQYEPYDSIRGKYIDPRSLISTGPFTLAPSEVKEFVVALVAAPFHIQDSLRLATVARSAENLYTDSLLGIFENEQLRQVLRVADLQIYPNPFSRMIEIRYQIRDSRYGKRDMSDTEIKIYDATGRLVKQFPLPTASSVLPAVVYWDGTDDLLQEVSQGIYFCCLETDEMMATQKIVKLK